MITYYNYYFKVKNIDLHQYITGVIFLDTNFLAMPRWLVASSLLTVFP